MAESAIERGDFSNFTEAEMVGSDNDTLMLDAESEHEAREFQRMSIFQQAYENGLSVKEAELVSGVSYADYVKWHKGGNSLHNQLLGPSPSEFENVVNIAGAGVVDANAPVLKKSFAEIFESKAKKPVDFLMKAVKKYEGGKRTQQVTVQGKHGTFTRQQTVGSDKQQQQKKKITKEGGNKPDFTPEEKMKHTMLQKFAGIFKKIGKSIAGKLKELKDPENIKKVGDKFKENVEATVVRNDGVAALEGDANAIASAAQKKTDKDKLNKGGNNTSGGGTGGGNKDNKNNKGDKGKDGKKKMEMKKKAKPDNSAKEKEKPAAQKKKLEMKKKGGK